MRLPTILACTAAAAAFVAAPAAARLVSPGFGITWGKPGITLAQYRADAIQCGQNAAATDLADTDPAKALVVGSRLIANDPNASPGAVVDPRAGPSAAPDALGNAGSTPGVTQMIAPDRQIAKAGDILERTLERCLTRKGYHKFKLTSEQRHRLAKLPVGSDARHAYLHSLASDPEVLKRQAVD
ncbi:MAG TPA: hypothetical protein VH331_05725 [Allosphingosinicella sp.]|jgi:hypothetical protein|nr:hypothetical protein [Allosphingosinicella sp.]